MSVEPIAFRDGKLLLIDQRRLPSEEIWNSYATPEEVAEAIRNMTVRGAPAIGVTAAYGFALAFAGSSEDPRRRGEETSALLGATRPTAVNLMWALARMRRRLDAEVGAGCPAGELAERLLAEAHAIREEDLGFCRAIGRHGAPLLPDSGRVLTHCNAGALATAGYGTALGVVRGAIEAGKKLVVMADETRPFLQGARLTAWELAKDGIPVELISDNMAGHFLSRGEIGAVVVGADRIAANGDTANKIGTYGVAVLAKENGVPFYVAAPSSTIDRSIADGTGLPIEERSADEVTIVAGTRIAPAGVVARHPAFDVTPARYVTAIVTEQGVLRPPYDVAIRALRFG